MMVTIQISKKTLKRIEALSTMHNLEINDFLNNLLDENEKINDVAYLDFCRKTEKALKEIENKPNNPMPSELFIEELKKW